MRRSPGASDAGRSRTSADLGRSPKAPIRSTACSTVNLKTYLVDDLLVKADRMSMAHGLEVRSPFLDTDLLTYAVSLPRRYEGAAAFAQACAQGGRPRSAAGRDHGPSQEGLRCSSDRWFREDLRALRHAHAGFPRRRESARTSIRRCSTGCFTSTPSGLEITASRCGPLLTLEVFLRREGW